MADFAVRVIIDPTQAQRGGKQVENSLKSIEQQADRLRRTVTNALTAIVSVAGLNKLIQVADSYQNIQNSIRNVTNSTEELNGVTQELFAMSQRTRTSFADNAEVFRRFALASQNLGLSLRDVLTFQERVNKAIIVSGANSIEAKAGLIQLSQALSSGQLRGEELRSVMEQIPEVARIIAREMGVTLAEMRQLAFDGKVTTDVIIRAFQNVGEELDKKFAKTLPTIGQAFQTLRNSFLLFIGDTGTATGASAKLAETVMLLANNMKTLADIVIVAGGAWAIYRVAMLSALGATVLTALAGNIVAFVQLAATVRTAAQATALLNAAFMVGPFALVGVLGAVAGAAYVFRRELEASLIFVISEAIIFVDKLIMKLKELADFGTTGLGALMATGAAKLGFVDESALLEVLAEEGNKKKNFSGASGFSADQLRNEANDMIAQLSGNQVAGVNLDIPGIKVPSTLVDQEGLEKALKRQKKLLEEIKGPIVNYKQDMADLNALFSAGKITQQEYNDQLLQFQYAILETDKTVQGGFKRGLIEIKNEFGDLSHLVSNTMVDAFRGLEDVLVEFTTTGKASFQDLVSSILKDLARIQVRQNITGPLSQALNGIVGGLFGGGGSIFGTGNLISSTAQFSSRSLFDLAGAAAGGAFGPGFATGGSFMVGGSGGTDSTPVRFMATPGEEVTIRTPSQQRAGSGVTINQTNNIDARGAGPEIFPRIEAMLEKNKKETLHAVAASADRGGSFAKSVGRRK